MKIVEKFSSLDDVIRMIWKKIQISLCKPSNEKFSMLFHRTTKTIYKFQTSNTTILSIIYLPSKVNWSLWMRSVNFIVKGNLFKREAYNQFFLANLLRECKCSSLYILANYIKTKLRDNRQKIDTTVIFILEKHLKEQH